MMTAGGSAAFYAYTTYLQKLLVNTAGFAKPDATLITAGALVLFAASQPLFGLLSDVRGRGQGKQIAQALNVSEGRVCQLKRQLAEALARYAYAPA